MNEAIDYEIVQLLDGTWQIWTPDQTGSCIGYGMTEQEAIDNCITNLVATLEEMKELK